MSLKPQPLGTIPEETVSVAQAAFPKGNSYMKLRDELGVLYNDEDFAELYPVQGQPALPPWRLALITVMQFMENLTDSRSKILSVSNWVVLADFRPRRQTAEAVRARIDWKYTLGLALDDPGFNFSVLSEFRSRLIAGEKQHLLLDRMLEHFKSKGLLKARGKQRTDSTHVLGAVRVLNRLELVGETLRACLNELATVAPEWVQALAPAEWVERYGRRVEEYRLPKGQAKREAYALQIAEDGLRLLDAIERETVLLELTTLESVVILRQVWEQQYQRSATEIRWRTGENFPPSSGRCHSPYDPEVYYSSKGELAWLGYKVHLSESCDDDCPHLITNVTTSRAFVADVSTTDEIHTALATKNLLPNEHFVDGGYLDASVFINQQRQHDVKLIGPLSSNRSWQAKAGKGYALENFGVDWQKKQVTCPQGKVATQWCESIKAGSPFIRVEFEFNDCFACRQRIHCTRRVRYPRQLSLQPEKQFDALQSSRSQSQDPQRHSYYLRRAGIEGTLSQGVRSFSLRRTRYRGFDKTALQHVATASAMNVVRVTDWLSGLRPQTTRTSRFARLSLAA